MHELYNLFMLIHVSYILESMHEEISSVAIRRSVLVFSHHNPRLLACVAFA